MNKANASHGCLTVTRTQIWQMTETKRTQSEPAAPLLGGGFYKPNALFLGHGGCGRDGGVVVETAVMMLVVSRVAGDGDGDGDIDGAVGEGWRGDEDDDMVRRRLAGKGGRISGGAGKYIKRMV
ncbi:hypothetical protein Tco_1270018, partial [Tanacetum coccineum]